MGPLVFQGPEPLLVEHPLVGLRHLPTMILIGSHRLLLPLVI